MKTSNSRPSPVAGTVEEVLGVDGPFSFPEKLFQRLWARREFDPRGARTADGRRLKVIHPGRWNHLGGPDFCDARLRIGEATVSGDVELHLRAQDWAAHAHAEDPAYATVVLHVVLFPPATTHTCGVDGRQIPIFALLPRLYHDLEEYAANAAVESLANRPSMRLLEALGELPRAELLAELAKRAEDRWINKVRFAGLRVARLGWVEACHHTALEILGYRYNRAPVLRVASRYPFSLWASGEIELDDVLASEGSAGWSMQGVRPANQPRTRLRQYADWSLAVPDWPERLVPGFTLTERATLGNGDTLGTPTTRVLRRSRDFPCQRERCRQDVCGGVLGGPRLDNLICDGFLPLVATRGSDLALKAKGLWIHWYPGDLPPLIRPGLRDLGLVDGARLPTGQGLAQGLLGWLLDQEHQS